MKMRLLGMKLAALVAASLTLVSCEYIPGMSQLQAIRVFKDANTAYQRADYPLAVELYSEVLANDPNQTAAYFYLANSYDNQYRPSLRGERENDSLLDNAIDNYIQSVDNEPNPDMRILSMQYLVAAFGPDKANQPAKSEPVLQQMIESDPSNPDNYFVLSKLYEDSGLVDEAEEILMQVRNMRADDPAIYMQIAGFYERSSDFERTIENLARRAELEPDNPEAFYTIGTYYWQKAFRDFQLSDEEEMEYVMLGLDEVEKALNLNTDYIEALTYKNILLRMQANLTEDLDAREALISEADVLRDLERLDLFHVEQYARLVTKMDAIKEGEGTLLDNMMFVMGSGLGSGFHHTCSDLPTLIAGSGGGLFETNHHEKHSEGTPIANLWLSMAKGMGVKTDRIGDSTGTLKGWAV